jgi:hypothetical protein
MSFPAFFRTVRVLPAIAGLFFVSACELGLQAYQQSSSGGCENWQAGCPIAVDFKPDGPALTTQTDVRRDEIVDSAAATEVRACPDWPNTCPLQIMGDVIQEQYFFVF